MNEKHYYENNRREMLAYIPNNAIRILEIGCGNGNFGSKVKETRSVEYFGVDLNNKCIEAATKRLDRAICANIEDEKLPTDFGLFDCIICNDVLEHLRDPWKAVRWLSTVLAPRGYIVASIPNIRHFEIVKSLAIHGDWCYTELGILDRTHLRFFTKKTIRLLFEQANFEVQSVVGINGSRFPWKFNLLNQLLLNQLDDMRWMQFACVARRKD